MNRLNSLTKPLMWFMALLMVAFVAGCSSSDESPATLPSVVSVAVTPATPAIPIGITQQFTATATYSDGLTHDVTDASGMVWSSDDLAVATISATGVATGIASGTAVITASIGGQSMTATLTVSTAVLQSIAVTPAAPSIPISTTQQFTAIATYDIGPVIDVTAAPGMVWSSGTPGVATIVPATGLATAVTSGSSVITADFGGQSDTATLTVNAAILQSIAVTPPTASVPAGIDQQFTATATYDYGPTVDVTTLADWTSGSANATIGLNTGLATGVTANVTPVVITADYGGQTDTADLTVTAATLSSIAVTPATPSIVVAGTQQFTATATYSDGTTPDVTADPGTVWTSSDPLIATIVSTTGLATGVAAGTTDITADFDGQTSPAVTLTVTAAPTTVLPGAGTNPTVLSSSPTEGDINVPTSSNSTIAAANNTETGKLVTATFNEPMDLATITPVGVFTLYDDTAASNVSGTVTMNTDDTFGHAANTVAIFKPDAALVPSHDYTATITTAAETAATNTPISSDVAWSFTTGVALTGQEPVDLLSILTKNFVILAQTGITQATVVNDAITGNIGVSLITGASITVSCPELVAGAGIGEMFTDDAEPSGQAACISTDKLAAGFAVADMGTAYTEAGGRTNPTPAVLATDISGLTLTPGIHSSGGAAVILNAGSVTGDPNGVTLDCQGDSNAVFIFQIAQTLTVGPGAQVTLSGLCQAKNIFWVVQGAAVIDVPMGSTAQFKGNLLSKTTIAMDAAASVNGRLLSQTQVTLIGNAVGP